MKANQNRSLDGVYASCASQVNSLSPAFELVELTALAVTAHQVNQAPADESVMSNGKLDMSLVNAIAFDPYTHGYYKVSERVGEAFKDGLKLK